MPPVLNSFSTNSVIATANNYAGWFCLRTQPKHEHLAAAHLREMDQVKVFLPRVRFERVNRRNLVWVTEALFPGYLFARFAWDLRSRQVQYARGVRDIVHFGDTRPVISEAMIQVLREMVGTTELHTVSRKFSPGDPVRFADGSLRGLRAVVSRVMPGRKRVEVLMELLGRQMEIELPTDSLIKEGDERAQLFER